jgi:hypothetical protein
MSTSTAPHDLAGLKHAVELGLVLAALVLAAAAAHGDTRLDPDLTAAPDFASMHTPGIATLGLNLSSTGNGWRAEVRRDVFALAAGCTPSTSNTQKASASHA